MDNDTIVCETLKFMVEDFLAIIFFPEVIDQIKN